MAQISLSFAFTPHNNTISVESVDCSKAHSSTSCCTIFLILQLIILPSGFLLSFFLSSHPGKKRIRRAEVGCKFPLTEVRRRGLRFNQPFRQCESETASLSRLPTILCSLTHRAHRGEEDERRTHREERIASQDGTTRYIVTYRHTSTYQPLRIYTVYVCLKQLR